MTRNEMKKGFAQGRTLIQEEWADLADIATADKLIEEGKATATAWEYRDNFQCEMRRVTGIILEEN